jgi:hypothetical protein
MKAWSLAACRLDEADFNHIDGRGRLRLEDLRMHERPPFSAIAARHEQIIFIDGEDPVRGTLSYDPELGWVGEVDWATQDVWESYPGAAAGG